MPSQRAMRTSLHILLAGIVILTLVSPPAQAADPPLPRSNLAMSEITRQLSERGFKLIGSGSWISSGFEGKPFRDPLNPKFAIKAASDFDMTLWVPKGTSPEAAAAEWRNARKALTELVMSNELLQKTPGAVEKILDKINVYPPDQLMAGVTSNAEALERCAKYGAVPKLNYNDRLTGPGLDADDLVGGVYGEGAGASRRWKEMTQGIVFENGKRMSADAHMIEQGMRDVTFTVKGTASMAKQWAEFASYWIEKGDPATAEKYISRMAADLKAASGLAGSDATRVANELQQLAATLKAAKGTAAIEALAGMRGQLSVLVSKAQYQASILERLTGASANQANLLWTLLEAADHTDSKLSKLLGEAISLAGGALKLLDILVKLNFSYDAVQAARNGDYDRMLADLLGLQNLNLPAAILGPLVQAILDDAKSFGYDLVASRQSCDDLLGGVFVGGQVEAQGFTIGQLVDAHQTEANLQEWFRGRSRQAADRGFEGTASDKITKGSADAIVTKCYPYVLGRWLLVRQQLYTEYRERWRAYAARGVSLVAQPEPAYLDPTTNKVTVQVTAGSDAQQEDKDNGYAAEKALQALGARLTGKPSSMVRVEFPSWSLAPDGGPPNPTQGTQSFTFTTPGAYELKVTIKLIMMNNGVQTPGMDLDFSEIREGSITIHVLNAEDKPLCGGGPVIKSATRTTLEHEVIPVVPGQVATPGTYINGAGDFSATDPKTGLAIGWQVREGMRYCEGCNCLPPKTIGTFEIAAAGRVKAVIESQRNVPVLFTMGSSNTSIGLYFESKIGQVYGKSVELLTPGSSGTNNPGPYRLEREADVSGPGRISAVIFAPRSSGSFTHACFDQSYTAKVEVLSIGKKSPVNGETKLGIGDHIRTDGWGEAIIVMPWGGLRKLMPNSDLSIERVPSTSSDTDCQEWTLKLNGGRLRVWSASIEEAEGGGGIQAGPYTVKP